MIQLAFAVNLFCYFLAFDSMMKNYIKKYGQCQVAAWRMSNISLATNQKLIIINDLTQSRTEVRHCTEMDHKVAADRKENSRTE